jgi:glycosyltransferase involved in cell wall biosynthesis
MIRLNPLEHPICLEMPNRLSAVTSWHGHIPFAMFLVDVTKPKIVVELGTHYGDSYCAFCQAIKGLKLATRCYAVDTWQGDPQAGFYGPEVLADLRAYHDPLYGSFSRLIQSTFDEAVSHFTDGTIDILHIDGYHIYEMIKHDFETWLPKMSKQGIILLHDINVMERDYGARKFWDEIIIKYPHFEFLHSHGLGVLAKGNIQVGELAQLFQAKPEEFAEIRDFFSQLGTRITSKIIIETKERENQNFKNEIKAYNFHINELSNKVKSLENMVEGNIRQINDLKSSHIIKNNQIKGLNDSLINKDNQLMILNNELKTKDEILRQLNQELKIREVRVREIESYLYDSESQVKELTNSLRSENNQIVTLQTQLEQIQHGIPMSLRFKYQRIVEKISPQGTRRRRYYQRALTGIRIILNEGWRSFFQKLGRTRNSKRSIQVKVEPLKLKELPVDTEDKIKLIDKNVSIIIPTKNAGKDFDITLERIRNQKGLKEINLIIVDSGSTDGTIQLSKNYGAEIYTIKPEEFNHGLTRNLGASHAAGDYILFIVQDAIPIGDYWLYNMAEVLENNDKLAAVTCRQIPRSDADLFACFSLWNHYKALEFNKDKIAWAGPNFNNLSPLEKRKLAGLEDVCALIKKDVFERFKYSEILYAEDLELGVKLIQNGFGIAFLYSTGIIHSHNRNPSYLLKRTYVDNKFLPEILSYDTPFYFESEEEYQHIFKYIITLHSALNKSIGSLDFFSNPSDVISKLKSLLTTNLDGDLTSLKSFERSNSDLDDLFDKLIKIYPVTNYKSNDLFIHQYFNLLGDFKDYLNNINTIGDKKEEFLSALYQILAIVAGSAYANYYLFYTKKGKTDENLLLMDRILSEAI